MIKYPNGKKVVKKANDEINNKNRRSFSSKNRGMSLESDINQSNEYYSSRKIAFILKRPTPIKVVKVDYSHGAKITDAYFEKQSTTDYNGVYKGRYIDFEAKSCQSKTSFPIHNITPHQIEHLKNVKSAGGIAFFIVEFSTYQEVFLIDADFVINVYENSEKKSISYQDFLANGKLIKQGLNPRLNYIEIIDEIYF